jgi:glycosyltransferase involved in cell wall biosynthesis
MPDDKTHFNLLVLSHTYRSFQKSSIEATSGFFSNVNIFVRCNPAIEYIQYFDKKRFFQNSWAYKTDLLGKPANCHVFPSPIYYLPIERQYKTLGDKHLRAVRKGINKNKVTFQIVHSHFTWSAGYVGARLKEEYNVPFVLTAHGYDIYSLPFKDSEWREKIEYVLNTADHVITVSQSNLACIEKLDVSTPVTVIPNGFRSDLFYPRDISECRKALNLPQDKKIILTVGGLVPIKDQARLVEAIRKIISDRKDILCVIVGAGKLRPALERQIRSLGLEGYVRLAGGKPHDEIPLWMNACDLFVLPSLRESFGVVQIEAMACGKPVVATRNGGSEEIVISEEYGLLVEPADSEDLAEKIPVALDREWDREAILQYAEWFAWENIAKDIIKIYRSLGIGD